MAIPLALKVERVDSWRSPVSFNDIVRTRFSDKQGNEYVHERAYPDDGSGPLAHRRWLRGE